MDDQAVRGLVEYAFGAASRPRGRRLEPEVVSKELFERAAGDVAALRAAWDFCVERVAEGDDEAYLLAATYFIPALVASARFTRR